MKMDLKERVRQRVEALGESPITLAKEVGLERGYINDILIGRKASIRDHKLELVAKALRCDVGFLTGQDEYTPRMMFDPPGLPVLAICQTGIWRDVKAKSEHPATLPVSPDGRYPVKQVAFIIRGYGQPSRISSIDKIALGIELSVFERAVRPIENGMIVVIQRERDGLIETSLRAVETGKDTRLLPVACDQIQSDPLPYNLAKPSKGLSVLAVITGTIELLL